MANPTAEHLEWLSLITISGPFLTVPVLKEALPDGLDTMPPELIPALRGAFEEKSKAKNLEEGVRAFVQFILTEVLGYEASVLHEAADFPETVLEIPELQAKIAPDFVLAPPPQESLSLDDDTSYDGPNEPVLLISIYPGVENLEKSLDNSKMPFSPARRMDQLCRATNVPLGLVTNGNQFMLVYARRDKTTSFITWEADYWLEERVTLAAFVTLLRKSRFFAQKAGETLPDLMEKSANAQQEVTEKLGLQVRSAITEFLRALDTLDRRNEGKIIRHIPAKRLYDAALTVMMRLVFLLSAEERGLMRLGEIAYDDAYAVSTLYGSLREIADMRGEEILEARHDAWVRLLSLFRAVHGGVTHEHLTLPAYGGSLFDPDVYPFLEGRADGSKWKEEAAKPLPVDDRVILHMLTSVQFLRDKQSTGLDDAVRLSFRALDVEQIGHVYEGLLDRTACRAKKPMLGLKGGSKLAEPWLPLAEAERMTEGNMETFVQKLSELTGTKPGKTKNAAPKKATKKKQAAQMSLLEETPAPEMPDQNDFELLKLCEGDDTLANRIKPYLPYLRRDNFDRPFVALADGLYVTAGSQRRDTGTHYTPRSLTEMLVTATLEPHVYKGPSEGLPREQWELQSSEHLLGLKICDMAMGSGAFLVQTCRYLSERLVEAWDIEQTPDLPKEAEERLAVARRMIADRCLYGVDNNPMAVEMAKLSLWLTTMQKDKPFTFLDHALQYGDALLGVTRIAQVREFDMEPEETQELLLGSMDMAKAVQDALESRSALENIRSDSVLDVERKSALLQKAKEATQKLVRRADALVMATLQREGKLTLAQRESLIDKLLSPAYAEHPEELDAWLQEMKRDLAEDNPGFTKPFHWALQFPEVFKGKNPGFDCIVGNPPFKGAHFMRGDLGQAYREYLVHKIAYSSRGLADLTAYFFLRAYFLIKTNGDCGLISTNTISQGETREVGLNQLDKFGGQIRAAWVDSPWEGNATVTTSQIVIRKALPNEIYSGNIILNNEIVTEISSFLKSRKDDWKIKALKENDGIAFIGTYILGEDFLISEELAQQWIKLDAKNKDVIFTHINGNDLNSSPTQSPSRFVINFFDWDEENCKQFSLPYNHLLKLIKPERSKNNRKQYRDYWWQYAEKRPALYHTIGRGDNFKKHPKGWEKYEYLGNILAICGVSKFGVFSFIENTSILDQKLRIFASDDMALFGILQSNVHHVWVRKTSSTLGLGLSYTPSQSFDTFPRPYTTDKALLCSIAEKLHALRSEVMLAEQIGLTDLYNNIHDPNSKMPKVDVLRDLHEQLDIEVAKAYGWGDLDMHHDFVRVEYLPDNDNLRHTIQEDTRLAILQRLLDLNKERYEQQMEEEGKVLVEPKPRKKRAPKKSNFSQNSLI